VPLVYRALSMSREVPLGGLRGSEPRAVTRRNQRGISTDGFIFVDANGFQVEATRNVASISR
jgi:hypothetical protein